MGQTVEPLAEVAADPLAGAMTADGHPPPPADGHADDLLSQLAGAEIDRMLAEADVEPAPPPPVVVAVVPPPVAPVPSEPAAVVEPAAPVAVAAAEPPPPASVAAAVPQADLSAVLAEAAAARPASPVQIDLGAPVRRRRAWAGLILRPLAAVNAPLDGWVDPVRDTVGKVALVTLVNAVGVIAYVMIFRRHA